MMTHDMNADISCDSEVARPSVARDGLHTHRPSRMTTAATACNARAATTIRWWMDERDECADRVCAPRPCAGAGERKRSGRSVDLRWVVAKVPYARMMPRDVRVLES